MKCLKNKNVRILLFLLVLLMPLSITNSYSQNFTHLRPNKSVRKVQQDQRYYSYERIMGQQRKLRRAQAKWYVMASKDQNREERAQQKLNKKIDKIKNKIR